jgi:hypothetical protein
VSRRIRHATIGAAIVAVACDTVRAQSAALRVTVVDAGNGAPIAGALVSASETDGVWAADLLTNGSGVRLINLPRAGRYRIRVRRIGFSPWVGETVDVPLGEPVVLTVRVDAKPITLSTIDVRANTAEGGGCERAPTPATAVGVLWEEARKALQSSAIVERDRSTRFLATSFERTLSMNGRTEHDSTGPAEVWRQRPFRARAASDLSKNGWARIMADGSLTFDAPDEASLLSREFEADHCFTVARKKKKGQIGLAFTPVEERSTPDITGTIWLDAATARLTEIEYAYFNPPEPARGDLGGDVRFSRLDDGRWIVSEWRIRMPRLGFSSNDGRIILIGYIEQGGTTAIAPTPR